VDKLLFDERILAEYAEVLARPRFALDPADVAEVARQLEADGERVVASPSTAQLADEDDLPFLEVALSGKGRCAGYGQRAALPGRPWVVVLSPRALLQRLEAEQ